MYWDKIYKELDLFILHAEEIFTEFHRSKSKALSELAGKISEYYKYQGDMKYSIQYLKKQVTVLKRSNHNRDIVASCEKNIAALYMEIGRPETALEYLRDVLHIRKHYFKPYSLEIAECYANIGYAYQELGEYKKLLSNYKRALNIHKRAFNIREKVDGIEGDITAQLHKKAIHIISGLYSSRYPRLLQFYEDLADTYLHFKEEKNALIYYKKALEVGGLFLDKSNFKLSDLIKKMNRLNVL